FEICADCGVYLVHEVPPEPGPAEPEPEPSLGPDPVAVFSSAREMDAELVRGMLASCGIATRVWSSGLDARTGHGALGSSAFPHRVMVRRDDAEAARALIEAPPEVEDDRPE
ncbi:MAG: DUF2007 domain-containing protein, partial [Actinomycetota bacterium]|nr:DUF2007 domain-containing protein [Actinomycetota bacterium]